MDKRTKTARGNGAVGKNAVVPRIIREECNTFQKMLDYGCGKDQLHVKALQADGYNVRGYDLSLPDTVHNFRQFYSIVYASNVLNVQETMEQLVAMLRDVQACCLGDFYCNYPQSPRKMVQINTRCMESILLQFFRNVVRVDGAYNVTGPVWRCNTPR